MKAETKKPIRKHRAQSNGTQAISGKRPVRPRPKTSPPKPFVPGPKDHRVQTYVRFPPDECWLIEDLPDLENGYVVETTLPLRTRLDLYARYGQFREGEPVGGLRLFVACVEARLYPPLPILKQFAIAVSKYLASEEHINLDEAFGLKPNTRSRGYFFRQAQRERDLFLCLSIFMLCCRFDLSIAEAAQVVYARYTNCQWKMGSSCVKMLTKSDLQRRYSTSWKQYRKDFESMRKIFKKTSEKEKREILSRFPYSAFPPRLRKQHPEHSKKM